MTLYSPRHEAKGAILDKILSLHKIVAKIDSKQPVAQDVLVAGYFDKIVPTKMNK